MYVLAPNQIVETFPYSIGALRRDNPNTSFPAAPSDQILADWGVFPVAQSEPPVCDPADEDCLQIDPVFSGGLWTQAWEIRPASEEEIEGRLARKQDEVRAERNSRLTNSDWTQLSDSPADHGTWAIYRQELRDVPDQEGFPWNVIWPEPPAA